jgi:hypothetical protein
MFDAMELSGYPSQSSPIHAAFATGRQTFLNLCETLSSRREGIMNARSRKRLSWLFKGSGMQFLMKPSDRLPESVRGEMLKVSRSPVREALFALESEGTVIMEPYKGGARSDFPPRLAPTCAFSSSESRTGVRQKPLRGNLTAARRRHRPAPGAGSDEEEGSPKGEKPESH